MTSSPLTALAIARDARLDGRMDLYEHLLPEVDFAYVRCSFVHRPRFHDEDRDMFRWRGVTRDSTSGLLMPTDASKWAEMLRRAGLESLGVPSHVWAAQESSGSLAADCRVDAPLYARRATGRSGKSEYMRQEIAARVAAGHRVLEITLSGNRIHEPRPTLRRVLAGLLP